MVFDIKGKIALITGGATGIGLAYSQELFRNGLKVTRRRSLKNRKITLLFPGCPHRRHRRRKGHRSGQQSEQGVRRKFGRLPQDRRDQGQRVGRYEKMKEYSLKFSARNRAPHKLSECVYGFCFNSCTFIPSSAAFQAAVKHFDRIDIVINNAGIMNDANWELQVAINCVNTLTSRIIILHYLHCLHFVERSCSRLAFGHQVHGQE